MGQGLRQRWCSEQCKFGERCATRVPPCQIFGHSEADSISVQGQLDTQNDLSSALGTLVSGWANVTATYLSELFSGTDAGMAQLDAYILGGNWSDPQFTDSLFALQGIMENVLYGGLIPKAWADHTTVHPVVVFQSGTVTNPLTVILQGDAEDGISDSVSHKLGAMQVFVLTIR